jgi:chorismate mutase
VQTDPGQGTPIQDAAIEATMVEHLLRLMKENDAPPEQFTRLGLEG